MLQFFPGPKGINGSTTRLFIDTFTKNPHVIMKRILTDFVNQNGVVHSNVYHKTWPAITSNEFSVSNIERSVKVVKQERTSTLFVADHPRVWNNVDVCYRLLGDTEAATHYDHAINNAVL